jgi:cytochrome bd-type quinol oxidase subunit 2
MTFDPARLRRGEWLAGASAVALLVFLFALKWYRPGAPPRSENGWHGITHLRWLMLVTILASLVLVYVQATRAAPAVPVSMSVIVTLLAIVTLLWLGYRVVISPPPHQQTGAFLGLAATIGIACGGYVSMREEGTSPRDAPAEIPAVSLSEQDGS